MKVLHICKVYLPTQGGVQVVVNWLNQGLAKKGWKSDVVSTSQDASFLPETLVDGSHVYNAKSYGELFSLPIAPGILRKIFFRANSYDVVCVHYPFPIADLAIALMPFRKFSLIVYWHSEIVSRKILSSLIKPLSKIMLRRADSIICSSPPLIEHSQILNRYKGKCVVIPFGMEKTETHTPQIKPSESNYFLFIGRHVPYKGIHTLIEAFAQLTKTHLSLAGFKLKIVGNGPLLHEHKKQAEELEISNHIEFLANLGNSELVQVISKARCLVLSSTLPSEAFALVQIEAMSHGRPIVNTQLSSGVPWVARNGIEAITVAPSNIDQLSQALLKLASDDKLADTLGEAAKLRFEEKFNSTKFINDTADLYRSIREKSND